MLTAEKMLRTAEDSGGNVTTKTIYVVKHRGEYYDWLPIAAITCPNPGKVLLHIPRQNKTAVFASVKEALEFCKVCEGVLVELASTTLLERLERGETKIKKH